jgi:hypothetical protein
MSASAIRSHILAFTFYRPLKGKMISPGEIGILYSQRTPHSQPVPNKTIGDTWRTIPQDAQKGRSARPQRVKIRGVPSGYVEDLNDARKMLADFFSVPLKV